MIAFIGNRPAIKIAHHLVYDYGTEWLTTALRRAAIAADLEDCPFLDDLTRGIETYLNSSCELSPLPLNTLYYRIDHMLRSVGCSHIAEQLTPVAPPIIIDLEETAQSADSSFELGFFAKLKSELSILRQEGAEEIYFTGLRQAVLHLQQKEKWTQDCESLQREISDFLSTHQVRPFIARDYKKGVSSLSSPPPF